MVAIVNVRHPTDSDSSYHHMCVCQCEYFCNTWYAGCPAVVRLDRGTENVKIAAVQYTFRENHGDNLVTKVSGLVLLQQIS